LRISGLPSDNIFTHHFLFSHDLFFFYAIFLLIFLTSEQYSLAGKDGVIIHSMLSKNENADIFEIQ